MTFVHWCGHSCRAVFISSLKRTNSCSLFNSASLPLRLNNHSNLESSELSKYLVSSIIQLSLGLVIVAQENVYSTVSPYFFVFYYDTLAWWAGTAKRSNVHLKSTDFDFNISYLDPALQTSFGSAVDDFAIDKSSLGNSHMNKWHL